MNSEDGGDSEDMAEAHGGFQEKQNALKNHQSTQNRPREGI